MLRHPNRYNTLRRVRKREEDRSAATLAQAAGAVQQTEHDITALRARHDQALIDANAASRSPVARTLAQYANYEAQLLRQIAEKHDELAERISHLEDCRRAFEERHVQRRIVDRLIERAELELEDFRLRQERRYLDDLSSTRYARRRAGKEPGR